MMLFKLSLDLRFQSIISVFYSSLIKYNLHVLEHFYNILKTYKSCLGVECVLNYSNKSDWPKLYMTWACHWVWHPDNNRFRFSLNSNFWCFVRFQFKFFLNRKYSGTVLFKKALQKSFKNPSFKAGFVDNFVPVNSPGNDQGEFDNGTVWN